VAGDRANPWISFCPERPDAWMRLICFANAGATGRATFRSWADVLPDWIELCAVELPGRHKRRDEPAHVRIAPLMAAILEGVQPLLDRPFALLGASYGGLLAWELAQRTTRLGRAPLQLFAVSAGAPDTDVPAIDGLNELSDAQLLAAVASTFGGIDPAQVNPEVLAAVLPGLRADLEVLTTYGYVAAPLLPCPIGVFGGQGDEAAPLASLEAWRGHTEAACFIRVFPGGHFFFRQERDALLRDIVAALEGRRDLMRLVRS